MYKNNIYIYNLLQHDILAIASIDGICTNTQSQKSNITHNLGVVWYIIN